MAIYDGYVQGYAGYYKVSDGSGPYSISSAGTITLMGTGGGSGGAGDASAANQVATNAKLDTLLTQTDGIEGSLSSVDGKFTTLLAQTDGVEGSLTNIDTNAGAAADAVVAGGAAGSLSAKVRRLTADIANILTRWPAALGGTTAANSLPVTLSTDGPFVVATGATNETAPATDTAASGLNGRGQRIAQRLSTIIAFFTGTASSDANRLPVDARDGLAVSGSVTSAATLFTQDLLGYESISVQITSAGTTCTITYECSEDQTTWIACPGLIVASTTSATIGSTSTTATILKFPRQARYFRARVSTYTSGTVTVVGSLSKAPVNILTSAIIGNASIAVAGVAAHGVAISGNPLRIGGRALTANYAAVATGQQADTPCTLVGALIQKPYSIPEADWSYPAAAGGISNSTVAVTIAAAAGAGIRNYLTGLQLSSDALGAATELAVRDGAGGTVLWRMKISTAGVTGGEPIVFPTPLKSTANTLLEIVTLTASITGGVFANAQGYTAP